MICVIIFLNEKHYAGFRISYWSRFNNLQEWRFKILEEFNREMPVAHAKLKGAPGYGDIKGNVYFYSAYGGTVVVAEVYGITDKTEQEAGGFLGFHIHEGSSCTGNAQDPFADAEAHYNPGNQEHPRHAGDLPSLLVKGGIAWMAVYTGRFYPEEVIGRTVIVHGMPDDYRTQPSGGSGAKIACGEIVVWEG